jgi:hypothetical protein
MKMIAIPIRNHQTSLPGQVKHLADEACDCAINALMKNLQDSTVLKIFRFFTLFIQPYFYPGKSD